jgi:hypothetical protein
MPYLKYIVNYINQTLDQQLLNDDCFSNKKVIGLAQLLPKINGDKIQLLPSYVDNDGEAQYVGPEDDYDLIIYHRITSILVTKGVLKSFGDVRQSNVNIAKVSLVAFGRRDRIKLTNDELAILLQAAIPDAATKEILQQLQFQAANINLTDIVLNDLQVFQEEFQNVEYFLKPEQFLFKINYQIESAFLKECFKTNCNCNN